MRQHASASIPSQLVHVLLSTPLAARSSLLRLQLSHRRKIASPLQPPGYLLRRRSRPIPVGVVAARRPNRHDQLVPRPISHSHQIAEQNRPRPHPHPLGRARRFSPDRNGSRKFALLHDRRPLHLPQPHALAPARPPPPHPHPPPPFLPLLCSPN